MKNIVRLVGAVTIMSLLIVSARPAFADPLGSYRWRNDDGSEAAATFYTAENAPISNLNRGASERLRFGAANSGTDSELLEKVSSALVAGDNPNYGAIDTVHGYAYFAGGAGGATGLVIKVRLGVGDAAPVRLGALTLNAGENNLLSGALDIVNGYGYFGTGTNLGIVVKVRLGDGDALPTRVGAATLEAGEGFLYTGLIDANGTYGYFGTVLSAPGHIVKVRLGDGDAAPVRVGAATLPAGENNVTEAGVDTTNGYLYAAASNNSGTVNDIIKVSLGEGDAVPTRVSSLAVSAADGGLGYGIIDPVGGYGYFGANISGGHVLMFSLGMGDAAPTRVGVVTLGTGANFLGRSLLDLANNNLYVVIRSNPASVVKLSLGTGGALPTVVSTLTLAVGENAAYGYAIDAAKGYIYFGIYNGSNVVTKVSIAPKAQFRLEYGTKATTCADVSDWTQVPVTATTEAFQMYDSANLTDGAATIHNAGMTALNVSFQPGQVKTTGSQTSLISLGEKQYTELEYSIEATSNAAFATTYCFRLTNAGVDTPFSVANYAEATTIVHHAPSSGGGGGAPVVTAPSITVSTPATGATFTADDEVGLDWTSADGAFTKYKVSYSNDNGTTWTVLSDNITSTNLSWIVPDAGTTQGLIKVEGYDASNTLLATGTSGAFTVIGEAVPDEDNVVVPPSVTDPTVTGAYTQKEALENNPDFNTDLGLLPATNPPCVSGSLIKGSLPSVYYCGADGKRYVFVNDKAYFSWYPDFSTVITISDADLALIPLGGNITYRPGSRMVKIVSDPKVYVVARGGILRWVSTEAVALRLFGANWNTMIDDVPDSFFVNYKIGDPITQ